MRKILAPLTACILLLFLATALAARGPGLLEFQRDASTKIHPKVKKDLASSDDGEQLSVIVTMKSQANLTTIDEEKRRRRLLRVIRKLQRKAEQEQRRVISLLQEGEAGGDVSRYQSFWVFNGLEVTATAEIVNAVARLPEVAAVTPNESLQMPLTTADGTASAEPNLLTINAPALWDLDYEGQGIVVANMDSGVYLNHPDLQSRWRGGDNSWFDPYGEHPSLPFDASGHGTWTLGIMAGGGSGGTAVGVAPQAQWIAARIFNDAGTASTDAIHQAFQWLLDPDGDPSTADAPHVVNGSWTFSQPGCNTAFLLDVASLRAAGILPIFAAGNFGGSAASDASPANYPESFAVGAANNSGAVYSSSGRGPSACNEAPATFPEVVAPGVQVRTTDLFGLYTSVSGTSMASAHVAGGLALLLQAFPDLTADEQEQALLQSAVDIGDTGPDNTFGFGMVDLHAAYVRLSDASNPPTPTPTAVPTATPLPNSGETLYLSSTTSGSVGGVRFKDEDILAYDLSSGIWSMFFDGSDVGLGNTDIDAFYIMPDKSILLSLMTPAKVAGVGKVDDSDVLRFIPTLTGSSTAGTFSLYFDGSDVGLTSGGEDINAIAMDESGSLLLSTFNSFSVAGARGGGEDILQFVPSSMGATTQGAWSLYFDGAAAGVGSHTSSLWVDSGNGDLYLSGVQARFEVDGISMTDADFYVCAPEPAGSTSSCTYRLFFDGDAAGFGHETIDGAHLAK